MLMQAYAICRGASPCRCHLSSASWEWLHKKNYGRISSKEPREHGGNMDNKELVAGTTLFLPVWNEGALFSVGDGHGLQGDGEVCLTALETAMTGTFELIVRKDMNLKVPQAQTNESYITMGFDPDLDDAAAQCPAGDD